MRYFLSVFSKLDCSSLIVVNVFCIFAVRTMAGEGADDMDLLKAEVLQRLQSNGSLAKLKVGPKEREIERERE